MIVSYIRLKNWRNFRSAQVQLGERMFIVGPNASGKSNFLDAFKFLRDVARKDGGGLSNAVSARGGLKKIRCLAARQEPDVEIEIHLSPGPDEPPIYKYGVGIKQRTGGKREPLVTFERIHHYDKCILDRPLDDDKKDELLLTQTHLEQISKNYGFRDVSKFLQSISYLHMVPQLIRYPKEFQGSTLTDDPFGRTFLRRIAKTPENTRKSRLRKIENALRKAVPQLKHLSYVIDKEEGGEPHLEAIYEHWRPHGAIQREGDFSDGTLRLIGLFWMLLEGDSLLLLEEPELSLNSEIVRRLPGVFYKLNSKKKRQIMVSTHSWELLSDNGIDGRQVILLEPNREGTIARLASTVDEIRILLEGGLSVADAVMPRVNPSRPELEQMELF